MVLYVNYYLKITTDNLDDNSDQIDGITVRKMKSKVEWQYRLSFISLLILAVSMIVFLLYSENISKPKHINNLNYYEHKVYYSDTLEINLNEKIQKINSDTSISSKSLK